MITGTESLQLDSERKGDDSLALELNEDNLKQGVLGLVMALVEIIEESLTIQAVRRMESGELTPEEVDRIGVALLDLKSAITEIKLECGIEEAVQTVRDGLDDIVDDLIAKMIDPEEWKEDLSHAEGR